MIEIKPIKINNQTVLGVQVNNPELPDKPAVILIIANKGLLVCGNFDIKELEKRWLIAARVLGLTKIEDALKAKVVSSTQRAKALGVKEGINGEEALKRMS